MLVAGGLAWRRSRQRTLADLIEAAPECAHDLARLLSAIRHEVLKHNTTLLEEMAHAGRNGVPDPRVRLPYCPDRRKPSGPLCNRLR